MPLASPETARPIAKLLTGEELEAFAKRRYGARPWCRGLAAALGVDPSTVWRMARGKMPVTGPVSIAIQGMQAAEQFAKAKRNFERQVERAFR
jgi:hypothetical protein